MFGLNRWRKSVDISDGPLRSSLNPYDQDETAHVLTARITGPWHPAMVDFLAKHKVAGLSFSYRDGFRCDDFGFFANLPFITLIHVPYPEPDFEYAPMPIRDLSGLKRLVAPFKVSHPIDINQLPKLTSCTMRWQPKLNSVFGAKALKRLQISGLNWKKTDGLADLKTLRNLEVAHSGIRSFAPIAELHHLDRLSLSVCHRLESLDGIENLKSLRCLHLTETSKVTSLDCLAALKNLEVLTIADGWEIESVAPLRELTNLKALWIAGTKAKIIDGDLTPLTRLPNLAMLTLGNKRHYSHRTIKKWDWANIDIPDRQLEPV
ncbi:MAG: hypothetical protein AAGK03_05250 [Pseudomonadota bacterium]